MQCGCVDTYNKSEIASENIAIIFASTVFAQGMHEAAGYKRDPRLYQRRTRFQVKVVNTSKN